MNFVAHVLLRDAAKFDHDVGAGHGSLREIPLYFPEGRGEEPENIAPFVARPICYE